MHDMGVERVFGSSLRHNGHHQYPLPAFFYCVPLTGRFAVPTQDVLEGMEDQEAMGELAFIRVTLTYRPSEPAPSPRSHCSSRPRPAIPVAPMTACPSQPLQPLLLPCLYYNRHRNSSHYRCTLYNLRQQQILRSCLDLIQYEYV